MTWCLSVFSEMQRKQNSLRQYSTFLPSVPASPCPSVASPDPVLSPTPPVGSGTSPDEFLSLRVPSQKLELTTKKEEDVVSDIDATLTGSSLPLINDEDIEEPDAGAVASITTTSGTTPTSVTPSTPVTPMTPNSLSDLSRPASSQLSYSSNLNSSLSHAPLGTSSPAFSSSLVVKYVKVNQDLKYLLLY